MSDAALTTLAHVVILATAVITLVRQVRTQRQVSEVHVLVNQRHADMVERERRLVAALVSAGIDVPEQ